MADSARPVHELLVILATAGGRAGIRPMNRTAKRIIVHGRVQGVGFRYFARHVGTRLGLTGDVRNRPDSTVEIIVEGPVGKVEEFVREMERGPSLAQVQRVDVEDIPPRDCYSAFLIEGW